MSRLSKRGPLPFNHFNRQLGNRCLKPNSINVTLICCLRLPDYLIQLIHSEQVSTLLGTSMNSKTHLGPWNVFFPMFRTIALLHIWVNSFMLLQVVGSSKWTITFLTTARSLSIVNSDMPLQNTCMCKWFDTQSTAIWFLSIVNSFMPLQSACMCKWFDTQSTIIRFLSSVNSFMPLQNALLCKWFGTLQTTVGLFSSVSSHMPFQLAWTFKRLGAIWTAIWVLFLSRVNSNMLI